MEITLPIENSYHSLKFQTEDVARAINAKFPEIIGKEVVYYFTYKSIT